MKTPLEPLRLSAFGRIEDPESPAPLSVRTGLDDDVRRPLDRTDPHYKLALVALVSQNSWSHLAHREFWTAFIHVWPRERGQRQLKDTIGWSALTLKRRGLSTAEIAKTLGYSQDTLRRYRVFERGEMIWQEQIESPGRRPEGPGPPLPRVYGPREDMPDHTWVNLPLPAQRRPPEVRAVEHGMLLKLAELDARE